jgi:hypothetical protein
MKPQNISIFILVMHKLKTFSTVHQPELLSQVIPDQEKKRRETLTGLATDYVVNSGKNNECTNQDRRKLGEQAVEKIASPPPFRFWQN